MRLEVMAVPVAAAGWDARYTVDERGGQGTGA
jgi:hypothetical protein